LPFLQIPIHTFSSTTTLKHQNPSLSRIQFLAVSHHRVLL
jgi:hypothetical protein